MLAWSDTDGALLKIHVEKKDATLPENERESDVPLVARAAPVRMRDRDEDDRRGVA
jgi:hypothetical protein